jgi:hypothetical protein
LVAAGDTTAGPLTCGCGVTTTVSWEPSRWTAAKCCGGPCGSATDLGREHLPRFDVESGTRDDDGGRGVIVQVDPPTRSIARNADAELTTFDRTAWSAGDRSCVAGDGNVHSLRHRVPRIVRDGCPAAGEDGDALR